MHGEAEWAAWPCPGAECVDSDTCRSRATRSAALLINPSSWPRTGSLRSSFQWRLSSKRSAGFLTATPVTGRHAPSVLHRLHDGRVFLAPEAVSQRLSCHVIACLAYRSKCLRNRLAVLPSGIFQTAADSGYLGCAILGRVRSTQFVRTRPGTFRRMNQRLSRGAFTVYMNSISWGRPPFWRLASARSNHVKSAACVKYGFVSGWPYQDNMTPLLATLEMLSRHAVQSKARENHPRYAQVQIR